MFRLSKKIEYALISLQQIAQSGNSPISAKELSGRLNLPFDFLSKTLQSLIKSRLVKSQQGMRGGYLLTRNPDKITIEEVITSLEGSKPVIVDCMTETDELNCKRVNNCSIRNPMIELQSDISNIFSQKTLADLINGNSNGNHGKRKKSKAPK